MQALQIVAENGPLRATTCDAAAQIDAQSWHVIKLAWCSFFPPASKTEQWLPHASQARWQSEQAFAQDIIMPWCSCCSALTSLVRSSVRAVGLRPTMARSERATIHEPASLKRVIGAILGETAAGECRPRS